MKLEKGDILRYYDVWDNLWLGVVLRVASMPQRDQVQWLTPRQDSEAMPIFCSGVVMLFDRELNGN